MSRADTSGLSVEITALLSKLIDRGFNAVLVTQEGTAAGSYINSFSSMPPQQTVMVLRELFEKFESISEPASKAAH